MALSLRAYGYSSLASFDDRTKALNNAILHRSLDQVLERLMFVAALQEDTSLSHTNMNIDIRWLATFPTETAHNVATSSSTLATPINPISTIDPIAIIDPIATHTLIDHVDTAASAATVEPECRADILKMLQDVTNAINKLSILAENLMSKL